jgi:aquaporin Z
MRPILAGTAVERPIGQRASGPGRMLRRMDALDYAQRGLAEFVGAFTLLFIGAGTAAIVSHIGPTQVAADILVIIVATAIATGLAIAVMVSAVGHISGGHFNPAVTLGFLVTRRIHPALAVVYFIVQFGGAALAVLLFKWIVPNSLAPYGAPALSSELDTGRGVAVEATLTFFLVWVVFAAAADKRGHFNKIAGLAIGGVITMGTLMAFTLTGAAMNPIRAFGPELVANEWKDWWIWYVGPLAGGVIAAVVYELLYLRAPEPVGMAAEAEAGGPMEPEEPAMTDVVTPDETSRWPAEEPPPRTAADE